MSTFTEPPQNCAACPRLKTFREKNRAAFPTFFNAPVPSFGPLSAELLIVGLAPGLKGANQTGRPFTGDFAGDLLYETLIKYGFAKGAYKARPDDGLELVNCRITNAVKCVPPQNKPVASEETNCRPYLVQEIEAMDNLKSILALGSIAHKAVLKTFNLKQSAHPFRHSGIYIINQSVELHSSYHCSRYNTNTRRLTPEMFFAVFEEIRRRLTNT